MNIVRKPVLLVLAVLVLVSACSCGAGSSGSGKSGMDTLRKDTVSVTKPESHREIASADSSGTWTKASVDTILIGDLNKDGIGDTAFLIPPRIKDMDCKGDCICRIRFSCHLPDLDSLTGIGGTIANAGDLDNNGICEIAFVPDWFTSAWHTLSVYGFRNNKWQRFGSVDVYTNYLYDEKDYHDYFKKRVKKIKDRRFQLIGDSLNLGMDGKDSSFTILKPTLFTIP
ncbi:MAG: hypothetical protein ACHQRM_02070 [Bacteroidia bacterium]